jgi:hypothetical protein
MTTLPTPAELSITPRDRRFGRQAATPRLWHGGRVEATAIYNALSTTFPAGEAFFVESVRKFRELVNAGKIGKPIFARSEFSFLADPSHPRKWLYDSAIAGAGPIFDIGVHCIDTLRFVLNDEVTRVSASAASDERSGDVESAA